jgi:hypothetical protein
MAKSLLGDEGVIEMMVEVGNASWDGGEKGPPIALSQWTSLALCHLVDLESASDSKINLSRLCFCNRAGELLVNSILASIGTNSLDKDTDAVAFNALSVLVSMCANTVGKHKVLSTDGVAKMLIQLMHKYSIRMEKGCTTESQWLLLLCLSLVSSSALAPSIGEKLVRGGVCRLLASLLVDHLLPAATRIIQQQSSGDLSQSTPSIKGQSTLLTLP